MRLKETIKGREEEMTGEDEEERGSRGITICSSVCGVKCVLTQFVAVRLSSTRINTECTSSFIFYAVWKENCIFFPPFMKHNNE